MKQKTPVHVNEIIIPPVVRITSGYLEGLDVPVISAEPVNIVHPILGVDIPAARITIHAWHPASGKPVEQSYCVGSYNKEIVSTHLITADECFPLEVLEA